MPPPLLPPLTLLPAVCETEMVLYDVNQSTYSSLPRPKALPLFCRFLLVSPIAALCFPGNVAETTIRMLDLVTCAVTNLGDMLQSRCDPGVLYYRRSVYIFGGEFNYSHIKSCEKLIQSQICLPLPDMAKGNTAFCPCGFQECIYLPSVFEEAVTEVLHLSSETFTQVAIPQDFPRWSPIMMVSGEELLVVGAGLMVGRWNLVTLEGKMEGVRAFASKAQVPASCAPVIHAGQLVWLGAFVRKRYRASILTS